MLVDSTSQAPEGSVGISLPCNANLARPQPPSPGDLSAARPESGGRTWIRTREGRSPRDLQSLLVGHLSILPTGTRQNKGWAVRRKAFLAVPHKPPSFESLT